MTSILYIRYLYLRHWLEDMIFSFLFVSVSINIILREGDVTLAPIVFYIVCT